MRFLLDELVTELQADLVTDPVTGASAAADRSVVEGLAADSRAVAPGQLFAALRGARDGHDFVPDARSSGASAALVERPVPGGPSLVVEDVDEALGRLARLARGAMGPSAAERVVGITGSVGKTTTKDLLAGVLGRRFVTAASERSFNNELGVPLTLANAPDDVEALVVEMGARGAGHIARLCAMAEPTIGVVTAVEAVHTEVMGGLEAIALAKGELIEALPPAGRAVLNADDDLVRSMSARSAAPVLTFGSRGDVRAERIEVDDELRARFELRSDWGSAEVHLAVRGGHNVVNALAAAAVGLSVGVPVDEVADALGVASHSPWRMELTVTASGARLLNDAYNAGPASTAAALGSLASLRARRHVAVLGIMAELGEESAEEHLRIARLARDLGVEVVAVGTDLYGVPACNLEQLEQVLSGLALGGGDAVLLKGSRVAGLERAVSLLG